MVNGDVALFKGVKCENFDPLFFALINHIWISDSGGPEILFVDFEDEG